MSPTIRHKYKYFDSAVQRAKDRRQKFHFCRLPLDVRPRNVKLNLSNHKNPNGDCTTAGLPLFNFVHNLFAFFFSLRNRKKLLVFDTK